MHWKVKLIAVLTLLGTALGVGLVSVSADPPGPSLVGASDAPTVESMRDGPWSDPSVWSGGKAPVLGSRVVIPLGTTVLYDSASTDALHSLDVRGTLVFSRNVNTNP